MSLQPQGSGDSHESTRSVTINRPVITPEPYNGEASSRWDQWIAHFDNVAQINGWDESARILWLQVRLIGKVQTAWERLSQEAKSTYEKATCALRQRFEPSSKRDLYAAEFQARKRREKESWGNLADDLRAISDRTFPDLEDKAREQLYLDRFLGLIEKPKNSVNRPSTISKEFRRSRGVYTGGRNTLIPEVANYICTNILMIEFVH